MKPGGAAAGLLLAACAIACGKEGPPLPPLVRVPAPPADVTAIRRGTSVDITLAVPAANTDGSKPANVQRVDLYAITAPSSVTDEQLLKLGTKVGSVDVKAPRDPNATVAPDDPASDAEPPEGKGLDQGATATLMEELTADAATPAQLSQPREQDKRAAPLPGMPLVPPSRIYAAVGVTTRGRHGPFSKRSSIPLVTAPAAPANSNVSYSESEILVTWTPPAAQPPVQEPASGDVLPSRLIGFSAPTIAFNVYEVDAKTEMETRLTNPPPTETRFVDKRIEWGAERCYAVRTVAIYDAVSAESDSTPVRCRTLKDTFPPKAPVGVTAVASEGAITLIWDANTESDLAGYLVFRAALPSEELTAITPMPIETASFRDVVNPGARYVYAIRAVDKAGNASALSTQTEAAEAR